MEPLTDPSRFAGPPELVSSDDVRMRQALESYFASSSGSYVERLQNFSKYVSTQDIRRFLCRYEAFERVLNVHGSVVECGVLRGGGLMTWAHLSEILEPMNHLRKIIGFDTFVGCPPVSERDTELGSVIMHADERAVDTYEDVSIGISIHNQRRALCHIPNVELVRGDVAEAIPRYVKAHPHLLVSLLHLDFGLYTPSAVALQHFWPCMPSGSIVVFDELNHESWPGATVALKEIVGIAGLRIRRFAYGASFSYVVVP